MIGIHAKGLHMFATEGDHAKMTISIIQRIIESKTVTYLQFSPIKGNTARRDGAIEELQSVMSDNIVSQGSRRIRVCAGGAAGIPQH